MELSFRAALEPCRQGNLQTSISRTFLVGCAIHETVIDSNIPGILWSTCSECIEERATGLGGLSPSIKNALIWIYIYIYIYIHMSGSILGVGHFTIPRYGSICTHTCVEGMKKCCSHMYTIFTKIPFPYMSNNWSAWWGNSENGKVKKTKGFHSMHEMGST